MLKAIAAVGLLVVIVGGYLGGSYYVDAKVVKQHVTKEQAQEIYENLLKYSGVPRYRMPVLVILDNDEVNAYADASNNEIGLYTGMLNYVSTPDELASVLGHEIGHILLQHAVLNPGGEYNLSVIHEGNADKFSIYLMLRAGYNVCDAQNLWKKMRHDNGDYETNSSHPNYSYRTWELQFPQCAN